jgi:hypothetical protein
MRNRDQAQIWFTEPHQVAVISANGKAAHRALTYPKQRNCVGEGYFFFFLPVFFFAFFAFLAMVPSGVPKLVQCKSTSTCINTKYTTIAKLILRASNKVNGVTPSSRPAAYSS